jgi:hypothetical protein
MSTDPNGTYPTGATPAEPVVPAATEPGAPVGTDDELSSDEDTSFFARHSGLITAVMTAVIVVAVAITGVFLWRNHVDDQNTKTEAAFSKSVEKQGASVDTVECDGGHCEAIIQGQAYSVLVQKDENGKQHFGVANYAGS